MSVEAYAPPRAVVRDVGGGLGLMSDRVVAALRKTRPWVLFLAILGFIGTAFTLLAAVMLFLGGSFMGSADLDGAVMPFGTGFVVAMGIFYLVIAIVYFFAALYLMRYASAIKRAIDSLSVSEMEAALEAQASFWKLAGILALVTIVISILAMILSMFGMSQMGTM